MFIKLAKYIVGLSCLMIVVGSPQAMQNPEVVAKQTVNQIVNNIKTNRGAYQADSQKLYTMIETVLVPTIHIERMSRLILAKNWRKANTSQQKQFVSEFKMFLLRSYASALLEYSGEKVTYKPSEIKADSDRVVVKAELVSTSGEIYPINLYMSNRSDDRWRAYNIEVAGINFVAQYRQTFGDIVARKGIDGLLKDLRQKNAGTGS